MTKKRFSIGMLKTYVNDNEKNYCYSLELPREANHLCNLLNELYEENQHLRKLADIGQTEPYAIIKVLNKQQSMIKHLKREKNDLNEELRVYRQVANCRNCEHHDYDWFDDGDEFEVCRKGNDVTEGICKDWEEL